MNFFKIVKVINVLKPIIGRSEPRRGLRKARFLTIQGSGGRIGLNHAPTLRLSAYSSQNSINQCLRTVILYLLLFAIQVCNINSIKSCFC